MIIDIIKRSLDNSNIRVEDNYKDIDLSKGKKNIVNEAYNELNKEKTVIKEGILDDTDDIVMTFINDMKSISIKICSLVTNDVNNDKTLLDKYINEDGFIYLITSKIGTLDPSIREYAFCATLNDMKEKGLFEDEKLIDSFTESYIKVLSDKEETDYLKKVKTLESFLERKGYNSLEEFTSAMNENNSSVLKIVEFDIEEMKVKNGR